ncbi:5420_t:CDS:2 [Gigaspora margarita]|uniref:5420_t:CDS:1 n=1 Tax=Gigaspora margarita TaxID=4874 RepID=A0ABN7UHJ9_GIGMA|nr:5420_t:CDS:2 [Gigaspora margarita]
MEYPNEEEYQATMGSSPDTNNTEEEMIDPTENNLVTPEMQIFTNNLAAQSNERVDPYTLETANKTTQPGDTESVVNKKFAASKKNKQIEKSRLRELNNTITKLKEEKAKQGLSPKNDHELASLTNKLHEETAALKNTYKENVETPFVTGDRPDEEMEVEPADSLKDTKEEITHEEKMESPITASTSSDAEMVVESSDPLRDKLADLYENEENKENLSQVVVEANTSVGDIQASMLLQIKNIEPDDFKVVTYKKSKARKAKTMDVRH